MYSLGASKEIVTKYLTYQFADGTINGHGLERMSLNQFRKYHLREIKEINLFLNNEIIKEKAIDRFIIKGRKSYYAVDAIICGTPDDFRWISINDVKKMIMKECKINDNVVHIGPLLCQPLNRCLNYNNKYNYGRYYVQIKWYSLFDSIIENIRLVLMETPPELNADISVNGIVLTGGGALLRGADEYIEKKLGIRTRCAEDPINCVINGIGYYLKNMEELEQNGYVFMTYQDINEFEE